MRPGKARTQRVDEAAKKGRFAQAHGLTPLCSGSRRNTGIHCCAQTDERRRRRLKIEGPRSLAALRFAGDLSCYASLTPSTKAFSLLERLG